MKICFVTTGDIKTIATAKRALGMANCLSDLGWEVSILMMDTEENRHRVSIETDSRTKVFYYPEGTMQQERNAKESIIKAVDPDYLYICAFVARNVVGIGHRSKKLVEHSELQSNISEVKSLKRPYFYALEYGSILYADALINASKYLDKVFSRREKQMGKADLPNLYLPYAYADVTAVQSGAQRPSPYAGRKVFVFLGSMVRGYGLFTMIEAMDKVRHNHPEALLLMLGQGPDYDNACNYVRSHDLSDNVHMKGYVAEEEISDYFSWTDYFMLPLNDTVQDWARCPSKLYMYLPYSKPVVTCKIGEPYEVLGDEGVYYQPSSADNLAEEMTRLLESGKTTISINPENHSWKQRTKEFHDWIQRISATE